jgi:hypothetical protein
MDDTTSLSCRFAGGNFITGLASSSANHHIIKPPIQKRENRIEDAGWNEGDNDSK